MKDLEKEVLVYASDRGLGSFLALVSPLQFYGIEINPYAFELAQTTLWIGYLQWHYRTRGDINPPQPVIRDFRNIENRDAVLAYDRMEYVLDERGVPVSRWDGVSMKPSPVTGEDVPDDSKRVPLERYVNPRKAAWPEAAQGTQQAFRRQCQVWSALLYSRSPLG